VDGRNAFGICHSEVDIAKCGFVLDAQLAADMLKIRGHDMMKPQSLLGVLRGHAFIDDEQVHCLIRHCEFDYAPIDVVSWVVICVAQVDPEEDKRRLFLWSLDPYGSRWSATEQRKSGVYENLVLSLRDSRGGCGL
jgi:hypothetical protein